MPRMIPSTQPPPTIPESPQQTSPLFRLPPELRLHIYELVASSEPEITFHTKGTWGVENRKFILFLTFTRSKKPTSATGSTAGSAQGSAVGGISLLSTCKRAYREAGDVVWDHLRFNLHPYPYTGEEGQGVRLKVGHEGVCFLLGKIRKARIWVKEQALGSEGLASEVLNEVLGKLGESAGLRDCVLRYLFTPRFGALRRDLMTVAERERLSRERVEEHLGEFIEKIKAKSGTVAFGWCFGRVRSSYVEL